MSKEGADPGADPRLKNNLTLSIFRCLSHITVHVPTESPRPHYLLLLSMKRKTLHDYFALPSTNADLKKTSESVGNVLPGATVLKVKTLPIPMV